MKTNFLFTAFFLLCVLSLSAGGSGEKNPVPVPGYTGIVQYLEGQVTMDGKDLEIGDKVKSGAVFSTGGDSFCEIIFGGKNIFKIRENTLAVITLEKGRGNLEIQKGSMEFLLEKLGVFETENPEFGVTTPSAAMGVRGTAFFVQVETPESTYICACNGSLQVEDALGKISQVLTGVHHKAVRFEKTGDRNFTVASASLLYHTDDDMNSLALRIDSEIPWDYSYSGGGY